MKQTWDYSSHGQDLHIHSSPKGGEWFGSENKGWSVICAGPSPTSFIVMAGDAFMVLVMKQNKTRLSMGLFSFLNGTVQVPEELIDDKHPLSYKPFDHVSYLHFVETPEAMQSECAIKIYRGV
ncbi:hypothetical protein FF1_018875 [Malus domestica]